MFLDDDYVPLAECARRMGVSEEQVELWVMARVLKAYSDGWGSVMVQPALLSGAI